jgi:hypothetical protein
LLEGPSIVADYEGHKIALFINGQQHSGENLAIFLNIAIQKKSLSYKCAMR